MPFLCFLLFRQLIYSQSKEYYHLLAVLTLGKNGNKLQKIILNKRRPTIHCVKIVQIRSFFWSVFSCIRTDTGKYEPEKTQCLDTFHAVINPARHCREYLSYYYIPEIIHENHMHQIQLVKVCAVNRQNLRTNVFTNPCKFHIYQDISLRKNCLYSELFWSGFPRIEIEYGEIRSISSDSA